MDKKFIHFIEILIILFVLVIGKIFSNSNEHLVLIYVSSFGFLSLLSILFVLSIPLIVKLKRNNFTASLLANRRWIGIYTFIFALIHVFLVFHFFFNWDINKIMEDPNRFYLSLGMIAFFILFLMAITSNDFSVRMLGKNWKKLHFLVYIALILIIIHSSNIGFMFMSNNFIKIIVIFLAILIIILKFGKKNTFDKKTNQISGELLKKL